VSCHGGDTSLETTLDSVSYSGVRQGFLAVALKIVVLFVQPAAPGNELFAELVGSKNKDVISFAAPCNGHSGRYAVAVSGSSLLETMNAKSITPIEL